MLQIFKCGFLAADSERGHQRKNSSAPQEEERNTVQYSSLNKMTSKLPEQGVFAFVIAALIFRQDN